MVETKEKSNRQKHFLMQMNFILKEYLTGIRLYQDLTYTYRLTVGAGLQRMIYPLDFWKTISRESKRNELDPYFVAALIRQESVFNPQARSSAGARGLMQLMPQTARLEANKLRKSGVSYKKVQRIKKKLRNSRRLFEPMTNILLGAHHLKTLKNRNNNDPVAVLASYNAGPNPYKRWKKTIALDDPLLFVEYIPYAETRKYIKVILRNYYNYVSWYGGRPELEQLTYLDKVVGKYLPYKALR